MEIGNVSFAIGFMKDFGMIWHFKYQEWKFKVLHSLIQLWNVWPQVANVLLSCYFKRMFWKVEHVDPDIYAATASFLELLVLSI